MPTTSWHASTHTHSSLPYQAQVSSIVSSLPPPSFRQVSPLAPPLLSTPQDAHLPSTRAIVAHVTMSPHRHAFRIMSPKRGSTRSGVEEKEMEGGQLISGLELDPPPCLSPCTSDPSHSFDKKLQLAAVCVNPRSRHARLFVRHSSFHVPPPTAYRAANFLITTTSLSPGPAPAMEPPLLARLRGPPARLAGFPFGREGKTWRKLPVFAI